MANHNDAHDTTAHNSAQAADTGHIGHMDDSVNQPGPVVNNEVAPAPRYDADPDEDNDSISSEDDSIREEEGDWIFHVSEA